MKRKLRRIPISEGSVRDGYRPTNQPEEVSDKESEGMPALIRAENGFTSLARIVRTATSRGKAPFAFGFPDRILIHKDFILELADEIEAARFERAPWESAE